MALAVLAGAFISLGAVFANVPKAILKEADRGKYAAVALGRTGKGHTGLKKVFMGSVTEAMYKDLKHAALWFCY